MKLIFSPLAMEQWNYWKRTNPKIAKRIKLLLADILEHPYSGIGKPEALRYDLAGKWSRRITAEHRLVYHVVEDRVEVEILSMKYHYKK